MTAPNRHIVVVEDAVALAEAAADRLIERIEANPGCIAICMTGGSSPKRLYELLATEPYRSEIPWDRVHWFIGDDRFVPPGDPLNNMSMARAAFLDAYAPPDNVHAIKTDAASPDQAAELYATELQSFYGADSVEAGWQAVQPFLDAWKKAGKDGLKTYKAGSEGPEEADDLLKRDGRNWRKLS